MSGASLTSRMGQNCNISTLKCRSKKNSRMSRNWFLFCTAFNFANGTEAGAQRSLGHSDSLFDLNWPPAPSTEHGFDYRRVDSLTETDATGIHQALLSHSPMEMDPVGSSPGSVPSPSSKESQARATSRFPESNDERVRTKNRYQRAIAQNEKRRGQMQRLYLSNFAPSNDLVSREFPLPKQRKNNVEHVRGFDLNVSPSEHSLDTTEPISAMPNLREGAGALRINGFDPEHERQANSSPSPSDLPSSRKDNFNTVTGERKVKQVSQPSDLNDIEKQIESHSASATDTASSRGLSSLKREWQPASPRSESGGTGSNVVEVRFSQKGTLTYFESLHEILFRSEGPGVDHRNARTLSTETCLSQARKHFNLVAPSEKKPRTSDKDYLNYAWRTQRLGSVEARNLKLVEKIRTFIRTLSYDKTDSKEPFREFSLYNRRDAWMENFIFTLLQDVKVVCIAFPEIFGKDIQKYQLEVWSLFKLAWKRYFSGDIENGVSCKMKTEGLTPEEFDRVIEISAKKLIFKSSLKKRFAASRTLLQIWMSESSPTLYRLVKHPGKLALRTQFINILNDFPQNL